MSWLNLNQSLNSLKGQITNFASEVLSEGITQEPAEDSAKSESSVKELEEKCRNQELEIEALKRLNSELEATLHSERFVKKNGIKDDETNWYWDPPPPPRPAETSEQQIKILQEEIATLKNKTEERGVTDEEHTKLKEELTRQSEENKTLTKNLEDLDNQHQAAMNKLLTLKKELQKNFEVLKVEHDDLKKTNSNYLTKIQDLESELNKRNDEIAEFKKSISEYENLHKSTNADYNSKIHDLETKLKEKNETISELQKSNAELSHQNKSNTNYESKIQELENILKERNEEIAELKKIYAENETLHKNTSNVDYESIIQDFENKLKEKNQVIEELKKSNETLSHQNTLNIDYQTKIIDLENKLKETSEEMVQLRKLNADYESLKNNTASIDYESIIKDLENKLEDKNDEIAELTATKVDYETLHHKYVNLEKVHSMLKETAEKFQEENQELHEEIFKLQERITKQEHEMELSTKHEMSNAVPREIYESIVKELEELKEIRNSTQDHLDGVNIDDNTKSVIENLKRDIVELKHKLAQKESSEDSDKNSVKNDKIMQLYNKYVNFEIPIDYIGKIPSTENNTALFKLETAFKTLNTFKKEIDVLEHKLSEKNHSINHLQTQIDDLTTENDFLTTDIQQIESELNEMKKNNDFLISEITALKNTSKLEPIIETHEDNLAKLETELADSNKLNKTFESEIKRIEKELLEVKAEKVVLQESLTDLKNKYTSMLQELEKFKTQTVEVEELELNSTKENNEMLKKIIDENDELKKKLNTSNAKNEQLSIDIHIIENDKVLLTKEIDDLKHILEEKNVTITELNKKFNDTAVTLEEIKLHMDSSDSQVAKRQLVETQNLELNEKLSVALEENKTLSEMVSNLKTEMTNLNEVHVNTLFELNSLKTSKENSITQIAEHLKTIDELKKQTVELEFLKENITQLKEENRLYLQKKLQAETELASTDGKILHLEEEFEKLNADLNEKDSIIDALNNNVTQNNIVIKELKQNIQDLENTVEIKNQEIQYLNQSLENVTKKLNEVNQISQGTIEEYKTLLQEKEDATKQIFILNEELAAKNMKISELTEQKPDTDQEIIHLNNTIQELTDSLTNVSIEHKNLLEERRVLEKTIEELKSKLTTVENELNVTVSNASKEKTELINLITLKHNESVQYHAEIQRLNQVLLEQSQELNHYMEQARNATAEIVPAPVANNEKEENDTKETISQRESTVNEPVKTITVTKCTNCERFKREIDDKDITIIKLKDRVKGCDTLPSELKDARDTIEDLKEEVASLNASLMKEQEHVKALTAIKEKLSEQLSSAQCKKEVERLRLHLLEVETNHTQEVMALQQKITEQQDRLSNLEKSAKNSNNVYKSNSIRWNQELETLRNQLKLVESQRDQLQRKINEMEDSKNETCAALVNLQTVLEQFQKAKEEEIKEATHKIQKQMEKVFQKEAEVQKENNELKAKLLEAQQGLLAGSRLSDLLTSKSAQINELKEQVRILETSLAAAEERYYKAISNQQDKVDKDLVKNLVINYVITASQNHASKHQILRVLSTVLDFNQQECVKLGLVRNQKESEGLVVEFVKFLQDESKPRPVLPNMMSLAQAASRSVTPVSRKSSTVDSQSTLGLSHQGHSTQPGHQRNPSSGSNNLLFQNLEESASQISIESEIDRRTVDLETGVTQTRNNEGAILKYVLKDM